MNPRRTLAVIAAGSALALAAGCGTATVAANDSSAPPKTELIHSVQELSKGKALTTTLSLGTTAADILRLASMGGGPAGLSAAQAQAIAGAHVIVEVLAPKGETLAQARKSPAKSAIAFSIGSGSATYLSVRSVGGSIYAQANVKAFLGLIGKGSDDTALQSKVASLPPFVKAFVAGKWVSISFVTIKAIESFVERQSHSKVPPAGQLQNLSKQLSAALLRDLTVTRPSVGKTDHLAITTNLRLLVDSFVPIVGRILPGLTPDQPGDLRALAHSVPATPIRFNGYVTGGALSKLTFDAGQFSRKHPFSLPIVASFARSGGSITAPSGATSIGLLDLLGLARSAGGISSSSSSSSGSGPAYPDYLPSASAAS